MARSVLAPASQTEASDCDNTPLDSGQEACITQHRQQPRRNAVLIPVPDAMALTDAHPFPTGERFKNKGAVHLLERILTTDALQPIAGGRTHNNKVTSISPCCSLTTGDGNGSNRSGDTRSRC